MPRAHTSPPLTPPLSAPVCRVATFSPWGNLAGDGPVTLEYGPDDVREVPDNVEYREVILGGGLDEVGGWEGDVGGRTDDIGMGLMTWQSAIG